MRVIAETVSFDTSQVWLWHIFNQFQCQMEHDSITFGSSDMRKCAYTVISIDVNALLFPYWHRQRHRYIETHVFHEPNNDDILTPHPLTGSGNLKFMRAPIKKSMRMVDSIQQNHLEQLSFSDCKHINHLD